MTAATYRGIFLALAFSCFHYFVALRCALSPSLSRSLSSCLRCLFLTHHELRAACCRFIYSKTTAGNNNNNNNKNNVCQAKFTCAFISFAFKWASLLLDFVEFSLPLNGNEKKMCKYKARERERESAQDGASILIICHISSSYSYRLSVGSINISYLLLSHIIKIT